jgi:hypothetical protein
VRSFERGTNLKFAQLPHSVGQIVLAQSYASRALMMSVG